MKRANTGSYHVQCVKLKGLTKEVVLSIEDYECPYCVVCTAMYEENDDSVQDIKTVVKGVVKEELNDVKRELTEAVIEAAKSAMKESTPAVVSGVVEKTKSYAAALDTNNVSKSSQRVVEEVTRKMDSDKVERERRKFNVVVMKVPESDAPSSGQRLADDRKFCYEQLQMDKKEIDKVWRAGKKRTDLKEEFHRPLIIKLVDDAAVDYWTDGGKGFLTDTGYWINTDLCEADRKANFLAREERRKRRSR